MQLARHRFGHEALPAVHLDRGARQLDRALGREVLRERREQPDPHVVALVDRLVALALARREGRFALEAGADRLVAIDQDARAVEQRARGLQVGDHARELVLHQRLVGDRDPELLPLARITHCRVERGLADPDRLRRDAEPRVVHQRQHRAEAAALLADPPRDRLLEPDHRGRRAVDAELLLEPDDLERVGRAVGQRARAQVEREAVGGAEALVVGVVVAREHEVHLRAAVGDEDLLAVEPDLAARLGGARADRTEVGAGLRLGQIHRAHQLARREAGQVAAPEILVRVDLDVLGDAGLKPDDRHQARVGARDHLQDHVRDPARQPITPVGLGDAEAHEPGLRERVVGGADRGRVLHLAADELRLRVPRRAQRRLELGADLRRRLEHGLERLALGARIHVGALAQRKVLVPRNHVLQVELDGRGEIGDHDTSD